MAKEVLIEYDKGDMIQISTGGQCVYHGKTKDFSTNPQALKAFLSTIGVRTYIREVKDLSEL